MINIDEKYKALFAERHDAVMMRKDMNRIFFNELARIEELDRPYDELWNELYKLAHSLKSSGERVMSEKMFSILYKGKVK